MRPQGTIFSDSARNRESVMNLGTIAHLQYYFARTGLLDGKGAQLARNRKKNAPGNSDAAPAGSDPYMQYLSSPNSRLSSSSYAESDVMLDDTQNGDGLVESPIEQDEGDQDSMMLPPTVSTYKAPPAYVPPPPDMNVLRRELREALDDAEKVLEEAERSLPVTEGDETGEGAQGEPQGFYEIQGLHILDLVTLAIRAAKNYYTAHEQPQLLYSIRSERQIRRDLLQVLDILKRMATRNFAGGLKRAELDGMKSWSKSIHDLLNEEEGMERAEQEQREQWRWRDGEWVGKEREREYLFMKSFHAHPDELPEWTDPNGADLPTPFLASLRNGLDLCILHNLLIKRTRRQFGEIKAYHMDTAKPYRCADNLRYWIKASELRWETKLSVDVMGVVNGDPEAWAPFDEAILKWCKAVREELITDWQEQRKASLTRAPTLKIDVGNSEDNLVSEPQG
jgi:hypothetical protein